MKLIGAHLSVARGLHSIQQQMNLLKSETCAIFLKNQRRFESPELSEEEVAKFRDTVKRPALILPHGSYLINLANPETVEKNMACLLDDLKRCHRLGIRLYNIHPGSNTKKLSLTEAIELVARNINQAHAKIPDVVICIEIMAGQGNVVGKTFEELSMIIQAVADKDRIGITLDTCHMFAGGYDIRTAAGFESVMKSFDAKVGLGYLKGVHLNDSKFDLGTCRDQHECIGKGKIGLEAFRYVMNSSYFEDVPMILETPCPDKYAEEIELLRSLVTSGTE